MITNKVNYSYEHTIFHSLEDNLNQLALKTRKIRLL